MLGLLAARIKVGIAVTGVIPVGSREVPKRALSKVLLPRLNCPSTATRSRPSSIRACTPLSLARISRCAGVGSGSDDSAFVRRRLSGDLLLSMIASRLGRWNRREKRLPPVRRGRGRKDLRSDGFQMRLYGPIDGASVNPPTRTLPEPLGTGRVRSPLEGQRISLADTRLVAGHPARPARRP